MRSKLTTTALLSDRFNVLDRATAAIAAGVIFDLGLISSKNIAKVTDKNKIRTEKVKLQN